MASYFYGALKSGELAKPPCKCCRLDTGTDLPVPKDLDLDEIRPLATSFSQNIFSDWSALNEIVKRHGSLIRKRWLKKGDTWRSKVLLSVQPTMSLLHRPDFEGYRRLDNPGLDRNFTCGAEAHLTPYINKEDLLNDHHLLLFINSRGRNSPALFAGTDAAKAHLGHGWPNEPGREPDVYMMLVQDNGTSREYANLVTSLSLSPEMLAAHSYPPIFGLLILEIQHHIYSFLLCCVRSILHDIDPADQMLAPEQIEPPPLESSSRSKSTQKIESHTIEADYRRPHEAADLTRLQQLVSSRYDVAEDHVRSLRENPGYFLDSLKEWREYHTDTSHVDDPER